MHSQSTPRTPALGHLRERCLAEGVDPGDEDLEAVVGFLDSILPALSELERLLPAEIAVAGLYAPGGERP